MMLVSFYSNTTDTISGAGTATLPETTVFTGIRVAQSLICV